MSGGSKLVKAGGRHSLKKALRLSGMLLGGLALALALVIALSFAIYSPKYMLRILTNGESKITDYTLFPERVIAKGSVPYIYAQEPDASFDTLTVTYEAAGGQTKSAALLEAASGNDTTAFLVIHKDKLVFERYGSGYQRDSVNTSFSSVKSLDSLLIGLAIQDGYIQSVQQPITGFLPEFIGTPFEKITLENLLTMRSNIDYREGLFWFSDDAKTYYAPDLQTLALTRLREDKSYHGQFHYNNYHPLLLGIILSRATGKAPAEYFSEKVWQKIGAEFDASWSLDSEKTGFEKMESGLNFRAIDYAKLGSMLLHEGSVNGQEIINKEWIKESTIAKNPLTMADSDSAFLAERNVSYQYMWYSIKNAKGGHDFFAAGKYGQFLYVSPENETVIVRTGHDTGDVLWWPDIFKTVAEHAGERP